VEQSLGRSNQVRKIEKIEKASTAGRRCCNMHLPINGMFGCFNTMATVLKQSPKQTTVVIYVLARDYVTKNCN